MLLCARHVVSKPCIDCGALLPLAFERRRRRRCSVTPPSRLPAACAERPLARASRIGLWTARRSTARWCQFCTARWPVRRCLPARRLPYRYFCITRGASQRNCNKTQPNARVGTIGMNTFFTIGKTQSVAVGNKTKNKTNKVTNHCRRAIRRRCCLGYCCHLHCYRALLPRCRLRLLLRYLLLRHRRRRLC